MNNTKVKEHKAEMAKNLPKLLAVTDSWFSAISGSQIVPFTKDDLHGLYAYYRAMLKLQLEKKDQFTEETKKHKRKEIDMLLFDIEQIDSTGMTSEPYYPPRQINCTTMILILLTKNAVTARLRQIFELT